MRTRFISELVFVSCFSALWAEWSAQTTTEATYEHSSKVRTLKYLSSNYHALEVIFLHLQNEQTAAINISLLPYRIQKKVEDKVKRAKLLEIFIL